MIKKISTVVIIFVIAILAYMTYMNNSGTRNRIELEKQKLYIKHKEVRDANHFINSVGDKIEERRERRKEKRQERRRQRRENN